jgi:hypothetical protein
LQKVLFGSLNQSLLIGIFKAEQKTPTLLLGIEKTEECGTQATNV